MVTSWKQLAWALVSFKQFSLLSLYFKKGKQSNFYCGSDFSSSGQNQAKNQEIVDPNVY